MSVHPSSPVLDWGGIKNWDDASLPTFEASALRLKRAGFDGADLCAFARHLIDQFWVPAVNRRTDEYGGSFENRLRFAVEVVAAIRAAVGRGSW